MTYTDLMRQPHSEIRTLYKHHNSSAKRCQYSLQPTKEETLLNTLQICLNKTSFSHELVQTRSDTST